MYSTSAKQAYCSGNSTNLKRFNGRLALGVDWSKHEPHMTLTSLWKPNHFHPKKTSTMNDMDNQFDTMVGEKDKTAKLIQINNDAAQCRAFMNEVIENCIVELANACNVVYNHRFQKQRICVNKKEVHDGLKDIEEKERAALVHFMTVYFREVLHEDCLGVSHEHACEDAFLEMFNITFGEQDRTKLTKGFKTCILSMYNECFNRYKHHLIRAVFPNGKSPSVERKSIEKPKGWKRDKHTFFFIH